MQTHARNLSIILGNEAQLSPIYWLAADRKANCNVVALERSPAECGLHSVRYVILNVGEVGQPVRWPTKVQTFQPGSSRLR
jgi:hypothetical protein